MLVLFVTCACAGRPIYTGTPRPGRALPVVPGARIAVFTLLLRRIHSSRSQGLHWFAELDGEDYTRLSTMIRAAMAGQWRATLLPSESILNSGVYRSGAFPTQTSFFLNPEFLPIVAERQHPELMLRSTAELKADLYAVVLLDFRINKLLGMPATISTTAEVDLYSPFMGLLGSIEAEDHGQALPYDGELPLSDLAVRYRPILQAAIRRSFARTLPKLAQKMVSAFGPDPAKR